MPEKIPLTVIAGPTATGKTAAAVELALKTGAEIVSADSMQIYEGFEVGTAKPDKSQLELVKHHLIGILPITDACSVAKYTSLARAAIDDIHSRGKKVILCGGTGLYINSLIDNIRFAQFPQNDKLRDELRRAAETEGNGYLHNILLKIDPESAYKIHPNNIGRVIRAIEVFRMTGITMSEHNRNSKAAPSPYDITYFALNCSEREKLYKRIDSRVDNMMKNGLVGEARQMYEIKGDFPAKQAIGYKEMFGYFDGLHSLSEAVEAIKRESRRYAKRQLTWFKKDERIKWILIE